MVLSNYALRAINTTVGFDICHHAEADYHLHKHCAEIYITKAIHSLETLKWCLCHLKMTYDHNVLFENTVKVAIISEFKGEKMRILSF